MTRRNSSAVAVAIVATLCTIACRNKWDDNGGDDASPSAARAEVLESIATEIILPGYERFHARAEALAAALVDLQLGPSLDALTAAQGEWLVARSAWGRTEAFLVGPPAGRFLDSKVDTSPIDEERIENEIAGTAELDSDCIESRGSTRKGFFAIEYLLFDANGDNDAVLNALTTGPASERRKAYLVAAGRNLADVAREFVATWSPGGDDYVAEFIADRRGSLNDLANRLVVLAETVADRRLGGPLGKTSGGRAQGVSAEAPRSGNSLRDVLDDVRGIANIYTGHLDDFDVPGLDKIVRSSRPRSDAAIRAAIERVVADLQAIPEPLLASAFARPDVVEAAFASAKELKMVLAVDLVGALDTTLTFSPFDGD